MTRRQLRSAVEAPRWQSDELFAAQAFECTAEYDAVIARWMAGHAGLVAGGSQPVSSEGRPDEPPLPTRLTLSLERRLPLRYGENPHQSAAMYAPADTHFGLAGLKQLSGKELSYNNLLDLDAAVRIAGLIQNSGAAVIKHTNPCGAASAATIDEALEVAMAADPTSAFGSIVAVNRIFDAAAAECLLKPGMFVEVIAAPAFTAEAVEALKTRPAWKASVRLVEVPPGDPWSPTAGLELRSVAGAMLAQRPDETPDDSGRMASCNTGGTCGRFDAAARLCLHNGAPTYKQCHRRLPRYKPCGSWSGANEPS